MSIIWVPDLYGMNQRQAPDEIPDYSAHILKNISLAQPGAWSKRKGTDLLSSTQAGNGVYGLASYYKEDGTYTIRAVRSTDLDVYSEGGDSWAAIDSAQFTASTKIQSANFLNRVYHISESDFLCYESGGACTEVGSGSDRLKATDVAVAQRTLFVSGVTYADGSAQDWENRIYYSVFSGVTPTHQLWTDAEGSLGASTKYIQIEYPIIGNIQYKGLIHFFTKKECWRFNLQDEGTYGPRKVFDRGLAGVRAVAQCNDWLIFMSPDKRLWAWGGTRQPMPLSWDIEDDSLGKAVVNAIEDANVEDVAIGALGNEFWVSVGDVDYYGETIENACLRGLVTQNMGAVLWGVDSLPVKPVVFENTILGSKEVLLFGSDAVDDVYRMSVGTNDGSTAIDAYGRTRFFDLGSQLKSKDLARIYIKYTPQSVADTYLEVKYALDGEMTYTAASDPDASTPVTKHNVIDMYESASSTNIDAVKCVEMPASEVFRTISIEIGNGQSSESFQIKAIGFEFQSKNLEINPNKAA